MRCFTSISALTAVAGASATIVLFNYRAGGGPSAPEIASLLLLGLDTVFLLLVGLTEFGHGFDSLEEILRVHKWIYKGAVVWLAGLVWTAVCRVTSLLVFYENPYKVCWILRGSGGYIETLGNVV